MPYLTPNTGAGDVCRSLLIPIGFLHIVNGALGELEREYNWESFGDMSVGDCVAAMTAMIDNYQNGGCSMIGVCLPYASGTIPTNMLECDGDTYDRVDYPLLYAALDTAYIVDEDTFITPNYSERFPRGTAGQHNESGGSDTHTLTETEIPAHYHAITNAYGPAVAASVVLGELPGFEAVPTPEITSSAGGSEPHNNMPSYHGDPWGIVYR